MTTDVLPDIVHLADIDADTGCVTFAFVAGEHRLQGEVPTVDEYRAFAVMFEGWAGVKLPGAQLIPAGVLGA